MSSASYFRKQAEICRQLSRTCFDLSVAGRLRELADEFAAKAVEIEQAIAVPPELLARNSDSQGEIG